MIRKTRYSKLKGIPAPTNLGPKTNPNIEKTKNGYIVRTASGIMKYGSYPVLNRSRNVMDL